ncbi:hypothetical protein AB751O23_AY_00090 [Chlamydiales bacterium SCGC AB-751-O23]|jgi:hypothetical protein|nr:hypothetical protein AB751O23_AY_00090 [Chlamydiales bacterium SCGC AB-751-O23]
MFNEKSNKSLLLSCLVLSIFTHALFFYSTHMSSIERSRKSVSLFENQNLQKTISKTESPAEKVEYTEELQEVLSQLILLSRQGKSLQSSDNQESAISEQAKKQANSSTSGKISDPSALSEYNRKQLFNDAPKIIDSEDFAQSATASLDEGKKESSPKQNAGQLVKGEVITSQLNEFDTTYKRMQLGLRNDNLPSKSRNPSLKASSKTTTGQRNSKKNPFNLAVPSEKEKLSRDLIYNQSSVMASSPLPDFLEENPRLEDLSHLPDISEIDQENQSGYGKNVASHDDFSIQLNYAKRANASTLFELKLIPKKGAAFKRIKQNIYFLVDRSSSISKGKFEAFKKAVATSLESLHPEDEFNILLFDESIQKFSETMTAKTKNNLQQAQDFLKNEAHGGLFASTDLYSSLDKIIPSNPPENQVNLAILLTDGDTYLDISGQRKTIYDWTKKNNRKVSLFTFASGNKNNLPLLELLSTFNKGSLFHTNFHSQLPNRLNDFIISRRNPIGKDIIINAITKNDQTGITLFPRGDRLPDLYENTPYSVYGEISQQDDFVIFLQGRHYQQWLNIKQKVEFDQAVESKVEVTNNWTLHRALDYYEKYLKEGILSDLRQANHLLSSLKTKTQLQ